MKSTPDHPGHGRTSIVRASLGPAPGKLVPVRFDPQNPSRATISSTLQSGRIFVVIGGGLLTLGLLALGLLVA